MAVIGGETEESHRKRTWKMQVKKERGVWQIGDKQEYAYTHRHMCLRVHTDTCVCVNTQTHVPVRLPVVFVFILLLVVFRYFLQTLGGGRGSKREVSRPSLRTIKSRFHTSATRPFKKLETLHDRETFQGLNGRPHTRLIEKKTKVFEF